MTNVEEAEVAIQCVNNTQPPGAVEKLTVRFAETLQEKIKRKQQVMALPPMQNPTQTQTRGSSR
jgi:hypothetical protein